MFAIAPASYPIRRRNSFNSSDPHANPSAGPNLTTFTEASAPIFTTDFPPSRRDILQRAISYRVLNSRSRESLMQYLMRQKWLAFGDDYAIQTPDGREAFYVDGRAFSWGSKLAMRAGGKNGPEVAFISQKLLSWGPTYEIYRDGQLFAVVKKELFTFFRCAFKIDVPGPNDYEAQGDFLDREYVFSRSGRAVGEVSKRFFSWTDTYGINIVDDEDDVTLLAATVVIDLCCHADRKK